MIADTDTVQITGARELLDAGWTRVLRQGIDSGGEAFAYLPRQGVELALSGSVELDAVGHESGLQAVFGFDRVPGDGAFDLAPLDDDSSGVQVALVFEASPPCFRMPWLLHPAGLSNDRISHDSPPNETT